MAPMPNKSLSQNPKAAKPKRILVVCHGNICRSPLVEALIWANVPNTGIEVRSCGLSGVVNRSTPKKIRNHVGNMPAVLSFLEQHRSKHITQQDVDWADMVLYMDGGNFKRLCVFEGAAAKARCLGEWINESRIADPNFMPAGEGLTTLLDSIERAVRELVKWLNCSPKTPHSSS
jgi:protein-tyrosine phosphatase